MMMTSTVWLKLRRIAQALKSDCAGQDLIEYALMAGFIVCGVVTLTPEIAASFIEVMSKANSVVVVAGAS